jgi:hypothetical protein
MLRQGAIRHGASAKSTSNAAAASTPAGRNFGDCFARERPRNAPTASSMTATISRRPISRACCDGRAATGVVSEVRGLNRVVDDVTSKPKIE